MDVKNKHPSSHPPHSSTLLDTPQLPTLEDLDITGNHVHFVPRNIQGSVGQEAVMYGTPNPPKIEKVR